MTYHMARDVTKILPSDGVILTPCCSLCNAVGPRGSAAELRGGFTTLVVEPRVRFPPGPPLFMPHFLPPPLLISPSSTIDYPGPAEEDTWSLRRDRIRTNCTAPPENCRADREIAYPANQLGRWNLRGVGTRGWIPVSVTNAVTTLGSTRPWKRSDQT